MARSKETTINEKSGKINKKKRFGKSIKNRCPGFLQLTLKMKFENSGGRYIEVPRAYRASQYDHTDGEYKKKKLSERMHTLSDGSKVQRDLYSSFLLYAADEEYKEINREKCLKEFENIKNLHDREIERIRLSGKKVLNSGIKVERRQFR